jgi:hypothetical protein
MLADGIAGISPMADMELIDDALAIGPPAPPARPQVQPQPQPLAAANPGIAPRPAQAAPAPAGSSQVAGPTIGGGALAAESAGSPVPIEALLYRGESALARARALSDVLRGNTTPTSDALAELYDLLDLSASA